MSHSLLRTAFSPCLLFALAAPIAAQTQPPLYFQHQGDTKWPNSLGAPTTMQRTVAADFTGDGTKDVFLLADGHAVFFTSPQDWDSIYYPSNTSNCSDIDAIPRVGAGPSDLVTVGTSGLLRLTYQGANGFSESSISSNSLFTGSTFVRAGFIDSGTDPDFVTWNPSQGKIVVSMNGGSPTSFSLAANTTVYDMMLLKYDGSSVSIGLLDTYGVEILTTSGARVKRFARVGAFYDDCFTAFHKSCDSREFIAWIRGAQSTPTTQELVELHWESDSQASQLTTTNITFPQNNLAVRVAGGEPRAPTSCTYADSDLVVSHLLNCAPLRFYSLHQSSPNASFDSTHYDSIDDPNMGMRAATIAGSSSMPGCVITDINNDGKADVIVPVLDTSGLSWVQFWRGTNFQPYYGDPVTLDGEGGFLINAQLPTASSGSLNSLILDITVPDRISPANCIEVVVWSAVEPDSTSGPAYLSYQSEGRYFYQHTSNSQPSDTADVGYPTTDGLASNGEYEFHIPIDLQLTTFTNSNESASQNCECFYRTYWFEVRQSLYWTDTNGGHLRAISRTRVLGTSSRSGPLSSWFEGTYSSIDCMADGPNFVVCHEFTGSAYLCTCGQSVCSCCYSVPTIPAPGTITRHRLPPIDANGTLPTPPSTLTFKPAN